MTDTPYFVILSIILLTLGFVMPFVNELATGESTIVDTDSLDPDDNLNFLSFAGSMLTAFFWYYGDLPEWANLIKIVINLTWLYILVKLIRGN